MVLNEKWNFRLVDLLVVITMALIIWNLKATNKLQQQVTKSIADQTIINLRLTLLEKERIKGERYTAERAEGDFNLMNNKIMHIRDMFAQHSARTEPQIKAIHDAVTGRNGPGN